MKRSERIALSAKRIAYLVFKLCPMRSALRAPRAKWILGCLMLLVSASGCTYFQRQLTPAELAERIQYRRDGPLEELVKIALAVGNWAVNGEGRARQVLELSRSDTGAIHRQFFEVQPRSEEHLDVFFLENKGSVDDSKLSRFPRHLRKDIRRFLEGLPEAISSEYKPLQVRQEKLSRRMIVYQTNNGERAVEFTQDVFSIERSNLYGLYHLPYGPFVFFGQESEDLFRKDFLEADDRYNELVLKFLRLFRPEIKL